MSDSMPIVSYDNFNIQSRKFLYFPSGFGFVYKTSIYQQDLCSQIIKFKYLALKFARCKDLNFMKFLFKLCDGVPNIFFHKRKK